MIRETRSRHACMSLSPLIRELSTGTPEGLATPLSLVSRWRLRLVWPCLVLVVLTAVAGAVFGPHLRAWHHLRLARRESRRYHTAQAIHHLRICRALWPPSLEAECPTVFGAEAEKAFQAIQV